MRDIMLGLRSDHAIALTCGIFPAATLILSPDVEADSGGLGALQATEKSRV